MSLLYLQLGLSFQVERLFSIVDGSRLVDSCALLLSSFASLESHILLSAGQWVIPCDTNLTMTISFRRVELPNLSFDCVGKRPRTPHSSERNYTLLPSDYIIGPTSGEPELCLTWPKASPPSPDGIDWQIGSTFLRTVYTVFRCDFFIHGPLIEYMVSCHMQATALPERSLL